MNGRGYSLGIVLPAVLLQLIGLLVLSSFNTTFYAVSLSVQVAAVALGIVAFFVIQNMPLKRIFIGRTALFWVLSATVLLVLTLLIGQEAGGATRWLSIGGLSLQTSEIAKLAVVSLGATLLASESRRSSESAKTPSVLLFLAVTAVFVGLIAVQPDLSTALIVVMIAGSLVMVGGISKKLFLWLIIIGAVVASLGFQGLATYQQDRIASFRSGPESDPLGDGFNVLQAEIAIGSAGAFGQGLDGGTQTESGLLPEAHTDFIFAALTEKLGLVGGGLIVLLSAIMSVVGFVYALTTADRVLRVARFGLVILLFLPFTVHALINTGMLPPTGIPLPFVSYGGSHIVLEWVVLGLLFAKR